MRLQDYLLLLLLGGAYLIYFIKQRRKPQQSRAKRTNVQLSRREQAAWRKLQARGYKLEEIHPEIPLAIAADQKKKDFTWEGNFTVSKGGKVYLVKVVKGDSSLASAGLRRELLLDYLVFQPAGMFLYDGEKEQLQALDLLFDPVSGGGKEKLLVRISLIILILVGLALLYRLVF